MAETEQVKQVAVGDPIRVVDENYVEHHGLVTTVHGNWDSGFIPCINAVYVSSDETKRDPYGQQIERLSSLQHRVMVQSMPRPGRYYEAL